MPSSDDSPSISLGLHSSDFLTSSSSSLSASDGTFKSSGRKVIKGTSMKQTANSETGKPFVPPKIIPEKRGIGKRTLPKRTPLPPPAPLEKAATENILQREKQLATLQTQLMRSRATIGSRWKEAWKTAGSSKSALSDGSDFHDSDDLSLSDASQGMRISGGGTLHRGRSDRSSPSESSPSDKARSASIARNAIMALLERELSSESDVMLDEKERSLNLTSSGFDDDLELDYMPHDDEPRLSPSRQPDFMPRPLQKLKLRLFQRSSPESLTSSPESSDSSMGRIVGQRLPSRETAVPEEHESMEKSKDGEKYEEDAQEEGGDDGESEGGEVEAFSSTQAPQEEDDEPQLVWEIEQVEEGDEPEPYTAPTAPAAPTVAPKVIRIHRHTASDLEVDRRLDEFACQEDFDRREMTDRIVYEFDDPLTPKMDKLRAERLRLAQWAKQLGGHGETPGTKPVVYKAPLMRPPAKGIGSTFPRAEAHIPLMVELSPRGEGIKARLMQNAPLPSTRVWQLEQQTARLKKQSAQQKGYLRLLQAALRKQTGSARSSDESRDPTASNPDGLSPRTLELKMYEEQCAYLGNQLNEEHDFCDAYRQQLNKALLKNMALQKRHENACEAIRQHKAIQEQQHAEKVETEEKLVDLEDQVEKELTKRVIETSSRQLREVQALTLQDRYAQLVHYVQEAEEKRSAFEEGLRTEQSNAQKAEALLQTKEVELAYARHYMETQDALMLEKEVLRRKERDRANLAERQVEQLNETVAAKDVQIFGLTEKLSDGEKQFQEEQTEHAKTRDVLQVTQASLKQREAEVESLQTHIAEHRKLAAVAQQKLAALEKLISEFEAFAGEAEADEANMEAWRDSLEARRAKALTILEAAEKSALAVLSQLDNQSADAQAVNALSQQVDNLRQARETELSVLAEKYKKVAEEKQSAETKLQVKDEETRKLQNEIDTLREELKREANRSKCAARRVIISAPAYGRKSDGSLSTELHTMRSGTTIEILTKAGSRRSDLRYLRMFKNGVVKWTEDLTGKKGYKKGENFAVSDIVGIDFGYSSSAYLGMLTGAKGAKSLQPPAAPWRYFTVRTLTETYEFRTSSDDVAQNWIIGLGRMSFIHAAPMITNRHELVVHRVRMKLEEYARQRGVSPSVIWMEAINTTLAQMPHIRERAAANKARQDAAKEHEVSLKGTSFEGALHHGKGTQADRHPRRASQSPDQAEEEAQQEGSHQPEESAERQRQGKRSQSPAGRHRGSQKGYEGRRRKKLQHIFEGKSRGTHEQVDGESPKGSRRKGRKSRSPHRRRDKGGESNETDKAPRKKMSRGLLSRAGSLFRRNQTTGVPK